MAERIPEEEIDRIRHSVDIVDVISDYVQLKKQGRNYFGLCPFHGESTPSFSVSPEKQIYHCFGCGAGGNAFSFVMEIEGFSFIEVVKNLAEKAGISLQLPKEHQPSLLNQPASKMIEAHELLKKFYHHLLVNTKEGQKAFDYLLQRGFTEETIQEFEIGFALDSWDFATKFLSKRGFSLPEMERAGLLVKKTSDSNYFDRFRNRVMFPIYDLQGRTIAFSGRILGEGQPKYLNSPETPIFNKSKTLYNFHRAKKHIRKNQEAVLLEGFADVISSSRAGCENAIATMGTALTDEQAKIIRRNVESIIICYDSDDAGIEAASKAAATLTSVGCHVKVATMPKGYDPDEYIQEYGADAFKREVIEASLTLISFKMHYLRRGKNLQNESERMQYIDDVLKEIGSLTKAVEQDYYLRQLSEEFSISLEALKQQFESYRFEKKKKDNDHRNRNNIARQQTFQAKLLPAYHNAERILLAYMLKDRELAFRVLETVAGNFNIEEHRTLITYLYAFYEEGHHPDISLFIEYLPDKKLVQLVSELAMLSINDELSEQALNDYVQQVLIYPKLLTIKEKEKEKQDAERRKDYEQAASIAMEIIQLRKKLKVK